MKYLILLLLSFNVFAEQEVNLSYLRINQTLEFKDEISKLDIGAYYGLGQYDDKRYLDGACGFNCMTNVLNAIGYKLIFADETQNSSTYLMDTVKE